MLVANRASTEVIDLFIDLNKGTVSLSSELFHSSACTQCAPFLSFSTILLQFSTLLASRRTALFRHFVFLMRLTVYAFFLHSSFLVPFLFAMQLFLQFLTFPIPGRSIISALSGNVQPRIKAPFPFQNFLSRPWSVKIRPTEHPVGYTWSNHGFMEIEFYFALSEKKWAVRIMGRRNNGPSE